MHETGLSFHINHTNHVNGGKLTRTEAEGSTHTHNSSSGGNSNERVSLRLVNITNMYLKVYPIAFSSETGREGGREARLCAKQTKSKVTIPSSCGKPKTLTHFQSIKQKKKGTTAVPGMCTRQEDTKLTHHIYESLYGLICITPRSDEQKRQSAITAP